MVATGDSMILPEITMEDSTTPAPAASARPASPISEYDFDVVEPDLGRESTFHGEVLADRPTRPELPPVVAEADAETKAEKHDGAKGAAPASSGDSAISVAGTFHDKIIEDHFDHEEDDAPEQARAVGEASAAPVAAKESKPADKPPERRATLEAIGPGAEGESATPLPPPIIPAVEAPAAPAASESNHEAVQEEITQLVAEVNEQVAQVSEKVEVVAAKVERVTAKMNEVTQEVNDVAETAGALQEAWTEFQGGDEEPQPGTSDHARSNDQSKSRTRRSKRKNRKR
jgi:hypothetical protein